MQGKQESAAPLNRQSTLKQSAVLRYGEGGYFWKRRPEMKGFGTFRHRLGFTPPRVTALVILRVKKKKKKEKRSTGSADDHERSLSPAGEHRITCDPLLCVVYLRDRLLTAICMQRCDFQCKHPSHHLHS